MSRQDSLKSQQNDEHKVFATAEEQILHRPGQWIGSRKTVEQDQYILSKEGTFELQTVEFNQGLAKLIEEVIINSADEHVRTKQDPKKRGWICNQIDVTLQPNGHVVVRDNGGIDTGFHSTGPRIVEVIFGSLFSSSNYDDAKDTNRTTVGTNGVGASLANLFSKRFKVTTADGKHILSIEWTNNKADKADELFTKVKSTDLYSHYTEVDYDLDLKRFHLTEIPDGVMKYIERLCAILAASNPGLSVTFNGTIFKFDDFSEYVKLFGDKSLVIENNEKWEVIVSPTYGLIEPRIIGVVNGAECHKGTHIQMAKKVINRVLDEYVQKANITELTSNKLSSSYNLYVKITVPQPEYTAQNKDELANTLYEIRDDKKRSYSLSSTFQKQLVESDIYKYLIQLAKAENDARNSSELKKAVKALKAIKPTSLRKLVDATESSSSKRKEECELWLFEGDSASSNFRPNRIPRTQGSYSLRGKMKNTTRMSTLKITQNQEIQDIMVAMGLDPREPENFDKLRYNKVIFCTDMDYDGFSIFALGFSMFATHFPELIRQGRLYRAITPLWKLQSSKEVHYFYSNEEYEQFVSKHSTKGFESTYFKGLGSLEKNDFKMILRGHTRLEQLTLDSDTFEKIDIFMRKEGTNKSELKNILRGN